MRNIVNILFCFILFYSIGNAQSIKRSVISSFGSNNSISNTHISSTLGQPSNIGTISDGSNYLRQGFQQPLNYQISINGCTDSTALNYDSLATIDDGSCIYNLYQEFIKSYDLSPNETARDIIELTDGNILIAGFVRNTSSNTDDALLIKIDTNGLVIWSKTYGSSQGDDAFYSVIEDGGFLYTCGYSTSYTSNSIQDVFVVKTDLNGNTLWSKTYGGSGCAGAYCGDVGHKIIKESTNSYIISGRYASTGSNLQAGYVLRIDNSGSLINDYIIDGVGSEWLTNVSIAQNGDLLLVGTNKVSTWEPWLLRMQPNGTTVFNKGYGNVTNHNGASDLVEFNNELYFLSDKAANICLTKLDASGDTLFVKEFGVSGSSYSKDILLSEDNNLYILGMIGNLTLLMKTDLNGDTLWTNYYQSLGSSLKLIEKDNHLYIIGGGLSNILLMKVPSDGTSNNCYKTSSSTFFTNSSDLIITNWSESNFSFTTTNTISSITSNLTYIPDTICQTILIPGCMDSLACNYDSLATVDDGSCLNIYGCTDSTALNYVLLATCEDGSCLYNVNGCTDSLANNYNPFATVDDSTCLYSPFVFGCTDSTALNYDPLATFNDSSCCYNSGPWTQLGIDIDGEAANDGSGNSVSISSDGHVIAVGAQLNDGNGDRSGHVRVYENIADNWIQIGQDIDGENMLDEFGKSVSLSNDGNIIAIGGILNDGNGIGYSTGHVRIYENISGIWTQIGQDINGENVSDQCGWSVSLNGNGSIVVIGSLLHGSEMGHVRVYEFVSGSWNQIGQNINGENTFDRSGNSVSINDDGSIIAIGAFKNDGSGNDAGHVRVFENISGLWTQIGQDIDGESANDQSGSSLCLNSSGNILVIGAPKNNGNGTSSGHARVYENIGGSWIQIGQDIDGESTNDFSGTYVSISSDGNKVAIGAPFDNEINSGYVKVYEYYSGLWNQIGQNIFGEYTGDQSGEAISLSSNGLILTIGARFNEPNGFGPPWSLGHARVYEFDSTNLTACVDLGCLDQLALNFDPYATVDDSSCVYPIYGCIDSLAINYNPLSNIDDGSCNYCTNDTSYTNISACDSVQWNGITYYQTGIYTYLDTNYLGCDSLTILDLTIENSFVNNLFITSCDSYVWDGTNYLTSGTYTNIYNNLNGCDSTVVLNLVINYSSFSNDSVTISNNYSWNGNNYTQSGIYQFSTFNSFGCDSTAILYLTILNNTGCTDPNAINYDVNAFIDDSSCCYVTFDQIGSDIDGQNVYNFNGQSVAVSDNGNIIAVGAHQSSGNGTNSGEVRVFENIGGSWQQMGQDIYGVNSYDYSGHAISLSSDGLTLAIGAWGSNDNGSNSGHVRIFQYDLGSWNQVGQNIAGESAYDQSGSSVSINASGTRVAIGAMSNNGNGNSSGHVRVYENISGIWLQLGQDINGENWGDFSGSSVSLNYNGDILAVGARDNDGNGSSSGHVRIYEYSSGIWLQKGQDIDGESVMDRSGHSVSISDDGLTVAIGAAYNDGNGLSSGHVRIYVFNNIYNIWSQLGQDIDGENIGDFCGWSINLNNYGRSVVVGSPYNDNLSLNAGQVKIFNYLDSNWVSLNDGIDGESSEDLSGWSVAIDGNSNTVIVGAKNNDGNGTNSGHIRVYSQISPCSGCTDSTSSNFDPSAIVDDGSCIVCIYGCTDPLADNYISQATCDDGSCQYLSLCSAPKPDGLFSYEITDKRAKIGWNNMNSNNCLVLKYFIRYRPLGTNQWITKSAGTGSGLCQSGISNISKQLLNLTPSTTYEYKMKAFYCGGTSSNYSDSELFTTNDSCPEMINLSVTTFVGNTSKARFDWDTTGVYSFARIALRVDTIGASWQTAGGYGVYYPNFFVNKFGLQQGQYYRGLGRTFCNPLLLSYKSEWTPLIFWAQPGIRINAGQSINNLDVYPNPSRDIFYVSFSSEKIQNLKIRILNVIGEIVYSEDLYEFTGDYIKPIDLGNYEKAIYFLEIQTDEGIINKKLILQ